MTPQDEAKLAKETARITEHVETRLGATRDVSRVITLVTSVLVVELAWLSVRLAKLEARKPWP
jgi:hypothetical protein